MLLWLQAFLRAVRKCLTIVVVRTKLYYKSVEQIFTSLDVDSFIFSFSKLLNEYFYPLIIIKIMEKGCIGSDIEIDVLKWYFHVLAFTYQFKSIFLL